MASQVLWNLLSTDFAAFCREAPPACVFALVAAALGAGLTASIFVETCTRKTWLDAIGSGILWGMGTWYVVLFGGQFFEPESSGWRRSWHDSDALGIARILLDLIVAFVMAGWSHVKIALAELTAAAPRPDLGRRFTLRQLLAAQALLAVVFAGWLTHARPTALRNMRQLEEDHRYRLAVKRFQNCGFEIIPSDGLLRFRDIQFRQDNVTDATLAELAQFGHIKLLTFESHQVTDEGLRSLGSLPDLSMLGVESDAVTDVGIASIVRLPKLNWLQLRGTQLTDEALRSLAAAPALTSLNVSRANITDAGLLHLVQAKSLSQLEITGGSISFEAIKEFRAARPDVVLFVHSNPGRTSK
jgi:hypothetical protein